jgi:hypothetical protein
MRLRKESPAQVLSHASGFLGAGHYGEVAALLDSVAANRASGGGGSGGAGAAVDWARAAASSVGGVGGGSPYTYTSRASIGVSAPAVGEPVVYAPLSSRLPSRPPSSQGAVPAGERTPQSRAAVRRAATAMGAEWPEVATPPGGSHSARSFAPDGSASAPASAGFSRPALSSPVQMTPDERAGQMQNQSSRARAQTPSAVAIRRTTFAFA